MSTLAATTIEDRASGDNTPMLDVIYGSAKVWVNFDGTGTVSIRDDYNVNSITDNGTGDYTVNFTNALADTNYAVVATSIAVPGTARAGAFVGLKGTGFGTVSAEAQKAIGSVDIACTAASTDSAPGNADDCDSISIGIFAGV